MIRIKYQLFKKIFHVATAPGIDVKNKRRIGTKGDLKKKKTTKSQLLGLSFESNHIKVMFLK